MPSTLMKMNQFTAVLSLLVLLPVSLAQFPPVPAGLDVVTSKVNSQVKISYKETDICETTNGAKSYSGYVHLPGSLLSDVDSSFDINTYFIYFEARHNASTAPLAVYLAGGPGESSIYTALASESGPCYVNVAGNDTTVNPWSFNNYVNVLYFDQPVQTGFSYDELVNGTFNLETQIITPQDFNTSSLPEANATFQVGTFSSQDPLHTTNTTVSSVRALWHAAEHWLSSFPEYSTSSPKLSIWANSYGGFWGPETAVVFSKNLQNLPPKHSLKAKKLTLDTLGLTNACIDFEYSMEGYPQFAYNNTYGIRFIPEAVYKEAMNNITKSQGCMDLIKTCRSLGQIGDPGFNGNNRTVNEACLGASETCFGVMSAFDALNNQSDFDVAILNPDPCPYDLAVTNYLNRPEVQSSLGVPLNFTYDSELITGLFGLPTPYQFIGTGDSFRQAGMPNIEYALAKGVKVAFVFGDRDYRCPWTGGEATAKAARWADQKGFLSAGYQQIQGISTGAKQGVVKQYGPLSFSRILDSGYSVSAYAPEAVYRVFERVMFGKDVVTGSRNVGPAYHTTGPVESWGWRNKLPSIVPRTCMVEGKFTSSIPWGSVPPP